MNEQRPAATLDRSGLRALWLGFGALLLTPFFAPGGVIAGVAAVVVAVKVRRKAQGPTPGAVPGLVMGLVAALFSGLVLAVSVIAYEELAGYQECLRTANTVTDEQACEEAWLPKIEDRFNAPRGTLKGYGELF